MKIRRVLIPLDLSEASLQALDYAIDLAKAFRPEFIVLFVIQPVQLLEADSATYTVPALSVFEEQRRQARGELAAVVARAKKRGVRVRSVIEEGSPYGVILDAAKSRKADLIVMSTHGRTGASRVLLGSVAEMVLRHAPCPVLTVRSGAIRRESARKPRTARRE
jgi:nucleotide-binding universal stress UspA family protein